MCVCVSELNKSAVMRLFVGDISKSSGGIVWEGQWDIEFGDGLNTSLFVLHQNAFKTKRGQLIERERGCGGGWRVCVCLCVFVFVCGWRVCVCV